MNAKGRIISKISTLEMILIQLYPTSSMRSPLFNTSLESGSSSNSAYSPIIGSPMSIASLLLSF